MHSAKDEPRKFLHPLLSMFTEICPIFIRWGKGWGKGGGKSALGGDLLANTPPGGRAFACFLNVKFQIPTYVPGWGGRA